MISFLICLALLVIGYLTYGKVVDNTFGPDDRETPAIRINDGVDYVVMPQWKLFLVQLLNIAGLGPIFGAMQGALWGPVVFLWITFGTIFAGGVHDYFSGMLSERNDGASISEVCGIYLGNGMKNVMRVFSVVLLVMVGTVFAVGPAGLIVTLFQNGGFSGIVTNTEFWLWIVLAYYFIATFLSIDKIIGKIYPVFGICLIIMAVGVGFWHHDQPPPTRSPSCGPTSITWSPPASRSGASCSSTVACGAISGFHATQVAPDGPLHEVRAPGPHGVLRRHGLRGRHRPDLGRRRACSIYEVTNGPEHRPAGDPRQRASPPPFTTSCSKTMGGVGVALAMLGVNRLPHHLGRHRVPFGPSDPGRLVQDRPGGLQEAPGPLRAPASGGRLRRASGLLHRSGVTSAGPTRPWP